LEALAAYVHVERARFGDGLEVAVSASAEARRFPVPCFLLQPLVENAVKHSFESGDPPWTVKVGADVRDGRLHVTVWNGGRLASPMVPGVGLGNLRRRLELVYPDGFQLDLSESEGGVRVGLVLEEAACSGSL
jgi:LytS/YehU family sensor histidine kinase